MNNNILNILNGVQRAYRVFVDGAYTREMLHQTISLPLTMSVLRNDAPYKLGAAEAFAWLAGRNLSDALITAYAPRADISLFTPQLSGYGIITRPYFKSVLALLRKDPATRRAVLPMFTPSHAGNRGPCPSTVQWICRRGELHTTVLFRSWDVVKGVPIDLVMVSVVSQIIAAYLHVIPGTVVAIATSLHAYETDIPYKYTGWVQVNLDEAFKHTLRSAKSSKHLISQIADIYDELHNNPAKIKSFVTFDKQPQQIQGEMEYAARGTSPS